MRRILILIGVIGIVILNLALLQAAIVAAAGHNASVGVKSTADEYVFTKIVTLTVYSSGGPITSSPNVFWQTSFISFPVQISATTALGPPDIPADAHDMAITIEGGLASISAPVINLTFTQPVANIYYEFYSNSIYRTGNKFKLGQTHSSNQAYHFIGTIFYTEPYQYAGYLSTTPSSVAPYRLNWDVVPPSSTIPDLGIRYRVYPLIWLNDPRIPPTLVFLPIVFKKH